LHYNLSVFFNLNVMEKLNLLMLGWQDPNVQVGEQEAWQPMARALADRVKLNVAISHNEPLVTIENTPITDVNNVVLPVRGNAGVSPENFPFAPGNNPASTISLYGAQGYRGMEAGKQRQQLPGEAVRAGCLARISDLDSRDKTEKQTSPVSLHNQIIQYTRQATRFAHHLKFDVIYAYHWQTYLAALELQLITGKKMVLQVHTLSQSRPYPDCRAWMETIEIQAFQKADAILVYKEQLAAGLERDYGLSTAKLSIVDRCEHAAETILGIFRPRHAGLNLRQGNPNQVRMGVKPRQTQLQKPAVSGRLQLCR
jgi:hypothetical protein